MTRQTRRNLTRRGFTYIELLVAASVVILLVGAGAGVLNVAGRLEQAVNLQVATDQGGAQAMNQMVLEVREASEVEVLAPNRFRIYYPVTGADGFYNRVARSDRTKWTEYAQTDEQGQLSTGGRFLWRRTQANNGNPVGENIGRLEVVSMDPRHIRMTLILTKESGYRKAETQLVERVLYLRNSPIDAPD
jgi:type II secretory pathway pseudopilin PulG